MSTELGFANLTPWLGTWSRGRAPLARGKAVDAARPAWLPILPAARRVSERADAQELPSIEDVASALEAIPNACPPLPRERGWDDWNRFLMAIWASTAGSEAGKALALRWSAKSRKFDDAETNARWEHFSTSPPTSIGYGTLVHEARAAGWTPASAGRAPSDLPRASGVNGQHALPEALIKQTTSNPLIELNKRYSVIGDVGGKCLVLSWVPSKIDRTLKVPSFQSFKSFAERYGNKYVKIGDEHKPLGAHWLKWPGRESYEGIDLVPNGPKVLDNGALNLWAGFGTPPLARGEAAGWPLMKRHICEVLAAGDPIAAEYIVKFAAWAVQHPGERAEVALVFRGGKGSGKGTFANALVRIFGAHGLQVFNSKHLVGAFNGHLRNCLLLFADEAFWAGDKQGESVLKGMLTERALVIEQKGVDAVLWENRLHVIMAANADWVVPASHDERRFAMFDVSNARVGDRAYFDALHEELNPPNGGPSGLGAMLHDLLRVELGDWHPRHIVKTEALRQQKEQSLKPLDEWWEELLQEGKIYGAIDAYTCPAAVVLTYARESVPRLRDVSANALGRFLRKAGADRFHREKGSFYQFKPLSECRALWEAKFGKWVWRNSVADWLK
jgi:Primase C terminal 2 (PriCT-2)/Family of unknown function (DUF5906)